MKSLAFKFKFSHSDSTKRSARVNDPFKYKYILLASPEFASSVKKSIARDLYVDLKRMT